MADHPTEQGDGNDCPHGSEPALCLVCKNEELERVYLTAERMADELSHIALVLKGPPLPGQPAPSWSNLAAMVSAAATVVAAARQYTENHSPATMRLMTRALDAYERLLKQH